MLNKIKELKERGKTIREIADILNLGRDRVHRILQSDKPQEIGQDTDTLNTEFDKLGVKKLRRSDYTKEELKSFPEAPYCN